MTTRSPKAAPWLGAVFQVLAIPFNLFAGFLTGLAAPVAVIAAIVAGVRLLTGKVPFLGHVWEDEEGGRHLSLKLVLPEQVKDLFTEQKEQIGGDVVKLQAEIRAIIEESRARDQAAEASSGESPAEA